MIWASLKIEKGFQAGNLQKDPKTLRILTCFNQVLKKGKSLPQTSLI
jgi:hypothetical protein